MPKGDLVSDRHANLFALTHLDSVSVVEMIDVRHAHYVCAFNIKNTLQVTLLKFIFSSQAFAKLQILQRRAFA
jgi:hypothetical protein